MKIKLERAKSKFVEETKFAFNFGQRNSWKMASYLSNAVLLRTARRRHDF